jgi:hypothetical protein
MSVINATPTESLWEMLTLNGKAFKASFTNADSDTAENTDLLIRTPAGSEVFTELSVSSTGLGTVYLYEAPTCTSAGATAATLYNLNRESTITSAMEALSTPTVSAAGTDVIWQRSMTGTTVQETLVLAADTEYLLRHTSAADNTIVALEAKFGA